MEFDFDLPGLGRAASSRPKRVAEAIRNELSILLLQKVADPRLAGAVISDVQVSPDLKLARIYFHVPEGTDRAAARKGMERAKGFFRGHIARTLNLRYTPELAFHYDAKQDEIRRIDDLFREIDQEREQ
jgi:ribosome-binding factor A